MINSEKSREQFVSSSEESMTNSERLDTTSSVTPRSL